MRLADMTKSQMAVRIMRLQQELDTERGEVERLEEIERFWHTYSNLAQDAYPRDHKSWMIKARELSEDDEFMEGEG